MIGEYEDAMDALFGTRKRAGKAKGKGAARGRAKGRETGADIFGLGFDPAAPMGGAPEPAPARKSKRPAKSELELGIEGMQDTMAGMRRAAELIRPKQSKNGRLVAKARRYRDLIRN